MIADNLPALSGDARFAGAEERDGEVPPRPAWHGYEFDLEAGTPVKVAVRDVQLYVSVPR